MKSESDCTREELYALLEFPLLDSPEYTSDEPFKRRAGKIIAARTPPGVLPKAWWV
jgi:hypothetical protein